MADNISELLKIDPFVRHAQKTCGVADQYNIPWRILYDYEIIFMTQGELTVMQEDKTYTLHANDFHIMRPFVRHKRFVPVAEGQDPHETACYYYNVHFDFFCDIGDDFDVEEVYIRPCELKIKEAKTLDEYANRPSFPAVNESYECSHIVNPFKIYKLFEELVEIFNSEQKYKKLKTRGIFMQILAELFENNEKYDDSTGYNSAVSSFIAHTINYYNENLDILKLCREYGFSPNYFRRLFKKTTHKTPLEFLSDVRIEQAIKLMAMNRYTISEISSMVGYDDIYYFSRLFKKKMGLSPKNYINKLLKERGSNEEL